MLSKISTINSILLIFLIMERLFLKGRRHFHKDNAKKAKEEALVPPKIEAKAKAKKTVLKSIYSTQNKTNNNKKRHVHHPHSSR